MLDFPHICQYVFTSKESSPNKDSKLNSGISQIRTFIQHQGVQLQRMK